MNSHRSILDAFDGGQYNKMACSVYRQADTKKVCKCNCVNQEVDELIKFTTDPVFNYAKFKDTLEIDYDAMENAKFRDEIFAFAKFIAQAILDEVRDGEICDTTNLLQFKKVLCDAIKTSNKGSVMLILLVWCKTCADRLIEVKNKKNYKTLCNVLDEFLNSIIDVIGKTLYVGMINIVKECNRPLYRVLEGQKEITQFMIAESLDNLYTTYKDRESSSIISLYRTYIIADKRTYCQWVGFMLFLKGRTALDYIYQVNNFVMSPLVKDKKKELNNVRRDPVLNQYNMAGGSMSFAELNEEADIAATLQGMACKGASALDEFFGTKCKYDSVSGLLGQVSKKIPKSLL